MTQAIEATGMIDSRGNIQLDQPLSNVKDQRVRIIVLLAEAEDSIDEQDWLKAAATNPSFAFLQNDDEDIYTINDGQPVSHEG